jgi:hypothetical protein
MKPIINTAILIFVLIVLGMLYRRFEEKCAKEQNKYSTDAIQNYLLDDVTLGKSKKPILWIHVPYEYNSRKWLSFGSRSSFELNQPYLYLTVRSILKHCDQSFTICVIDDNSFEKLIPGWNIDMSKISSPISDNMRKLGIIKLIYIYGGLNCPISFLCMRDLIDMYSKGTQGEKMFLCENNDKNVTSSTFDFYPNLNFCGAPKNNETVKELLDFMQRLMSRDYTAQSQFLGDFDRWCNTRIQKGQINMIKGYDVGIKTVDDTPIKLEDLMSNHYLNLYPKTYGIWIPADQILSRRKYEWFARLSQKQVLETETILGNYFLVNLGDEKMSNVLEPLEMKPDWVGFWKVPSDAPNYGLKPNFLGDNVQTLKYPGR